MYSSCLYCHGDLGKNESVGHFPVGRRLAFDSANGRLWVICGACRRWNLSPLEERWDAIDECERLFEKTRLRMSTDNIGLARIAEGTELVRVGAAMRPEMAAWRFGAQLAARRRQYRWLVAGGVVVTAGLVVGVTTAGVSVIAGRWAWNVMKGGYERVTRLTLPNPQAGRKASVEARFAEHSPAAAEAWRREARTLDIKPPTPTVSIETKQARDARIVIDPDDDVLQLTLPVVGGSNVGYTGVDARNVAPKLLAKVNRSGGSREDERHAVAMLEGVASDRAPDLFAALLRRYASQWSKSKPIKDFGTPVNLALEMALQEQRERELLAGELLELEFAWREAEELTRIADSLGSTAIDRALARLKAKITG
ncbi:MAG: hypothetical protein AABZ29_09935 [Gemmatimonadota bacterium]